MNAMSAPAAIIEAVKSLRAGEVVSYSEVARRAGLPGRARLVARVLAQSSGQGLPWHRVLRADGRIAFPPDSENGCEQVRRLRAEGVTVERGRVTLKQPATAADSLDSLLWGPQPD
jgi:methylated-DNA-protein-cysteine methyltransferase-like protein